MSGTAQRWVAFIRADDRSGVLTGLASVFSTRGVSFESFDTLDAHDGIVLMSVTFRGSDRLARVLVRTLERLAAVRSISLERADAGGLRAIAVIRTAEPVALPEESLDVVADWAGGGPGERATVIVAGRLAEVEAALAPLRDAGATASVTILAPEL